MACSMKLCLRFSAHAPFLAGKHETFLATKVIPDVLLVITMNYRKKTKLNISENLH